WFSDGIYYDFFDYYRERGDHHQFSSFFGQAFEAYVGEQLRAHYDPAVVIPERRFKVRGEEWSGPDWVVIECESALLIECKASRLQRQSKTMADSNAIRADLETKLLKVIKTFPEKISHMT